MLKRNFKKFIAVFCVLLLLSFSVFSSYNRTKASGTLVAGAALVITALASYMAASGLQISSNSNSSASDVVSMWETICADFESNGKTLQSWYGSAGSAVNIIVGKETGEKFAVVSTALSNWFADLRDWLQGKYNFNTNNETVMMDSLYVNTSIGNLLVYDSFSSVSSSGLKPQSIVPVSAGSNTIIDFGHGYYLRYSFSYNSQNDSLSYSSFYITPEFGNVWVTGSTLNNIREGTCSIFLYKHTVSGVVYLRVGTCYRSIYSGSENLNYRDQENRQWQPLISQIDGSQITVSGELADGYQDYQDALDQAQSDAGLKGDVVINTGAWDYDGALTREGVAEAYLDRIAATGTAEGTLTGGYSDEKEAEEETEGEYVPSAAWYDKNFVVVDGLEDFFPFCIPFDLYEIIALLNVPPEAPHFQWKMNFDNRFDDYDIDIDLAPYETVALVFRIMVIIGFLIFLTLKTRDLIRG